MEHRFTFRIDKPRQNIAVDDLVGQDFANLGVFFVTDGQIAGEHRITVITKDASVTAQGLLTILNDKYKLDGFFIEKTSK